MGENKFRKQRLKLYCHCVPVPVNSQINFFLAITGSCFGLLCWTMLFYHDPSHTVFSVITEQVE